MWLSSHVASFLVISLWLHDVQVVADSLLIRVRPGESHQVSSQFESMLMSGGEFDKRLNKIES